MDKKQKTKDTRQIRDKYLQRTYGVTLKEYEAQVKRQKGKCVICDKIPNRSLVVDHIHVPKFKKMEVQQKRQYIRALLCSYCNLRIVGAVDRPLNGRAMLERIYDYFTYFNMKSDVL